MRAITSTRVWAKSLRVPEGCGCTLIIDTCADETPAAAATLVIKVVCTLPALALKSATVVELSVTTAEISFLYEQT
jgi:hypothetical protein